MPVHTNHPVAAPPSAPIRETTGQLLLRGWCIFVMAAALGGTSWLMLAGVTGAGIVAVGSTLVSLALWLRLRPEVQWRRLPWFALLYVGWAVASLAWTAYPDATMLTLVLLLSTTAQAMFVGSVLTWREIVRAMASALKWILALSIAFELWVALVWGGPILPGFGRPSGQEEFAVVFWSRDHLFDGERIQGLFGDANSLAYVSLLAMIVFAVRYAANARRRGTLIAWFALAAFLFWRASSATATLAAIGVLLVFAAIMLMRGARTPRERARFYALFSTVGAIFIGILFWGREWVFSLLERSSDLSGRERIWGEVWQRAIAHPLHGWGFSTPWVPTDPQFAGWIVDQGETVMQAHNMWVDIFFQLGAVGVFCTALTTLAFTWRSWFFAVDRPRWDLVATRPYSPVTLVSALTATVLLVQGLTESSPLMGWGWFFLILLAFKIKQAPLVGRGPTEQRLVAEQGEPAAAAR